MVKYYSIKYYNDNITILVKILILIIIALLINGCANDVCITPEEIYAESTNITMHAYPKEITNNDKKNKPWVELGWTKASFRHTDTDINLKTSGNANMCGISKDELEASSKIPLNQTNDAYFTIDYSLAQNTIDIGMQVIEDDILSFTLDKIKASIDCNNPADNINIRDKDACMNGIELDIKGQKIKMNKYQDSIIGVDYGSSYTKPSNFIIFFTNTTKTSGWITGGENGAYDFIIPMTIDDTEKQDCTTLLKNKHKYPAYIINRTCGFFCPPTYNIHDAFSAKCALGLLSDQNTQTTDNKIQLKNQYLPPIAKLYIKNNGITNYIKTGNQIQINSPYKVEKSGELFVERLPLSVYGGFKLKVKRDCAQRAYNSLYIYVSNTPPKEKPSERTGIKVSSLKNIDPKKDVKTANTEITHSYLIDNRIPQGDIYLGFNTEGDIIENNTGTINVILSRPRVLKGLLSSGVKNTRDAILDLAQGKINAKTGLRAGGASDDMYNEILNTYQFKIIIYAIVSLFITMQGFFYFTGIAPLTKEAIVISIIKVSVVVSLMAPTTAAVYRNFLQGIFINGMDYIINITTSFDKNFSPKTDFSFIDSSLGRFAIHETWVQVLALFLSGPLGWLALLFILVSVIIYGFVAIKAIVLYLMSLLLIVFLTALLPLFVLTLLFKFTSRIFHTWIKVLVTNMIKPILIFITLAILNQLMMSAFFDIFNFSVCDDCVLSFRIFAEMSLFCLLSGPLPVGYDPVLTFEEKAKRASAMFQTTLFTLPVSLDDLFFMTFIAFAAKIIAERSATMASSITGTFGGSITFQTVAGMMDNALGLVGMDKESRNRRARSMYQSAMSKKAELTGSEKDALQDKGIKRADGSKTNASTKIAKRPNDLDIPQQMSSRKPGSAKDLNDLLNKSTDPYDQEEIYDEINENEMDEDISKSRNNINQANNNNLSEKSTETEETKKTGRDNLFNESSNNSSEVPEEFTETDNTKKIERDSLSDSNNKLDKDSNEENDDL